jgi:hypothetical protein
MREVALEHVEPAADILNGTSAGADLPRPGWNFGAENWSYYESGDDILVFDLLSAWCFFRLNEEATGWYTGR